jgi:hypothetical protein
MPGVPERIAALLPDVRLIAILREPGRRAYAQYLASRRLGRNRRSFAQAVTQEIATLDDPIRPTLRLHYLVQGLYADHLARYIACFGRSSPMT